MKAWLVVGMLALQASLGAVKGDYLENPPRGPAEVRADELGLRYRGSEGWYAYQQNGCRVKDGHWEFLFRRKSLDGYYQKVYEAYGIMAFSSEMLPTTRSVRLFDVTWVRLLPGDDWRKLAEQDLKDRRLNILEFRQIAGPVKDRLGGRPASTLAYEGQQTMLFSGDTRSLRVQLSMVPMAGGLLIVAALAPASQWEDFRPTLRAFRRSFRITDPPKDDD